MEVKLKFLNSLSDLVRKFRFASDTLEKADSNVRSLVNQIEKGKDFLGENDKRIIQENLINTENPHKQLRKTISIDYEIFDITRALLQEFVRHPVGNPFVVKSTRYALHRIAKDERINGLRFSNKMSSEEIKNIVQDYYYISDVGFAGGIEQLEWIDNRYKDLIRIKFFKIEHKMPNDYLKKYINEYMYCNVTGNISGEALYNLLRQRLDKSAWYQFQDLAKEIYKQIPEEWKPLFHVFKYNKVDIDPAINEVINVLEYKKLYIPVLNELRNILSKNLVEKIDLTKGF